jgi:hypothetical protein
MRVLVAASLFWLAGAAPASAADLTFGLKAEARAVAGLDAETRALIERMPETIRVQTMKLLVEALPLIDQSVNAYLDKANEIVSSQIAHAGCTIQGAAKGTLEIFKAALPMQADPTPILKLAERWDDMQTTFDEEAAPLTYIFTYADFLANAAITSCQVENSEEAVTSIQILQSNARIRWQTWRRTTSQCADALTCFEMTKKLAQQQLASADARDVQAADGPRRFSQIATPARLRPFQTFRQKAFEDGMIKHYRIVDAIALARVQRQAKAEIIVQDAKDRLAAAGETLSKAQKNLRSELSGQCILKARTQVESVKADLAGIAPALTDAQQIWAEIEPAAREQTPVLEQVQKDAAAIGAKANAMPIVLTTKLACE